MSAKIIAEKKREYIFGPVPSRRLGRSLGVDLVPFKTCSYDCIYCQLGKTTNKTIKRKEWVPIDIVTEQLKEKLDSKPDYITLSGSGEPTLYSRLEDLISWLNNIPNLSIILSLILVQFLGGMPEAWDKYIEKLTGYCYPYRR